MSIFNKSNFLKKKTEAEIAQTPSQKIITEWKQKYGNRPLPSFLVTEDGFNDSRLNLEDVRPLFLSNSKCYGELSGGRGFEAEKLVDRICIKADNIDTEIFPKQFFVGHLCCFIYDVNGQHYTLPNIHDTSKKIALNNNYTEITL